MRLCYRSVRHDDAVPPIRVLFLCVHNSARSQMAEGLLRSMADGVVEVQSAGLEEGTLRSEAVEVMAELGLDISMQHSKTIAALEGQRFDFVVTTCEEAKEACPYFPGARETIHWDLPDPSAVPGDRETRLDAFREVRNELWAHVADLIRTLERDQAFASRNR
jgi:arsenate reductase